MFSSLITVLKVNEPKPVKTKSGKDIFIHTAECMLLDDQGGILKVGQLGFPDTMKDTVRPGEYAASFGLTVSEYGQDQGRIVARLTGLLPAPPRRPAPTAAGASKPV